jgi:long-subunit acyl-CoA synthetase (AMP-forming)
MISYLPQLPLAGCGKVFSDPAAGTASNALASRLTSRLDDIVHLGVVTSDGRSESDPRRMADGLISRLRAHGFGLGERLAASLPNGPEFAAAFIACVQRGLTFVPLDPGLTPSTFEERVRLANVTGILTPDGNLVRRRPLPESTGTSPVVVLFTSGSSGDARAIALGEVGLLSVVDSHHAALGYPPRTRILGCLPWTHAFGFTLEFLMGLLKGAELRSVPPASFVQAITEHPPEVLFGVPRTVSAVPDAILSSLAGGIVGGAPIRGSLRPRLARTRLRVGYGQTECSPGATLGSPGEWEQDDFLGRPLGCEVVLGTPDDDGGRELLVRGSNTALGSFEGDTLKPVVGPDGWLATGDLAVPTHTGGFVFQGRSDDRFKLDNGRMVNPAPLELPFEDRVLLIGAGQSMVQPLVRGDIRPDFTLPIPHRAPRRMPESFWAACTTPSGKVSRRRAEQLFASS